MQIAYIVNPIAGSGRAQRVWAKLAARHPHVAEHAHFTRGPGHGEEIAAQLAEEGCEAVVAVGGDGTLHEVLNGVLRATSKPCVGVIPAGTGNDFARSVSLPRDPEKALEVCQRGQAEPIDVGLVNGRAYINVAGFGFDAAVAEEVASRSNKGATGPIPYLMAVLHQLITFRPRQLSIHMDDQVIEAPVLFGAVGNGSTYGGGMKICPRARVDDGLLDLCVAGDFGPFETLVNLLKVFRGSHVTHPKCQYFRAQRVVVDGDPSVRVHADGQLLGGLPVTFEILPQAVRFLMGPAFQRSQEETRKESERDFRLHA